MWVNQQLFDAILAANKDLFTTIEFERVTASRMTAAANELRAQKAKDDLHIDWLRHRVNALEKVNAQLLTKVTGVAFPVPEIVANRPGTMTLPPEFDTMPSFEDVGDEEATRLGLTLDDHGQLQYAGKSS